MELQPTNNDCDFLSDVGHVLDEEQMEFISSQTKTAGRVPGVGTVKEGSSPGMSIYTLSVVTHATSTQAGAAGITRETSDLYSVHR